MTKNKPVDVHCPSCKTILTVDPETGDVLLHKKPITTSAKDISNISEHLKKEAQRREESFLKSVDAERRKGDTLQKKFDEALKRAKENPDQKPPLRDIDLD